MDDVLDAEEMGAVLLGEMKGFHRSFEAIEAVFEEFASKEFAKLTEGKKRASVNRSLLELIQKAPKPAFLLSAVVDFVDRVAGEEILESGYDLNSFEFWLNTHAGLSDEENLAVRGLIAGKFLPRDEYQAYFPIGGGRTHPGTHFVSAHNPPDLDTAVASFWGWLDAFGARVGRALHVWNLPGGAPPKSISRLFTDLFGPALFSTLPRSAGTLSVRAQDLACGDGLECHGGEVRTLDLDHNVHQKLILHVDTSGRFVGSWRSADIEGYRLACLLANNLWRWFSTHTHIELVSLLSRKELMAEDVTLFVSKLLATRLREAEPTQDLTARHSAILDRVLQQIFHLEAGLEASYGQFLEVLPAVGLTEFAKVDELLRTLGESALFDESGRIKEDRPLLASQLQQLLQGLVVAFDRFRSYLERLDVAVRLKAKGLQLSSPYVLPRASLGEVVEAMGPFMHVPVVETDAQGNLYPVGVIHRHALAQKMLGTVSLRDFCNREEVKIADHLEVISVVDHHRASLQTSSFPTTLMGDVQSSNTLLAEQSFQINDRYGLGGFRKEQIPSQVESSSDSAETLRLVQRKIRARIALATRGDYFVHPAREFAEYLSFLHAILDDTDLLDRVTSRDVLCVAELVNRLKSLQVGRAVEVVTLDDIPRNDQFCRRAAKRILQTPEMYSLYSRVYKERELELKAELTCCIGGKRSSAFSDTKEQKGVARVGQIKLFPENFPWYLEHAAHLRAIWLKAAMEVARANAQLDLHIQMISTISGAEEVFQGVEPNYTHSDELWLWIPSTEQAYDHLEAFLRAFRTSSALEGLAIQVQIVGPEATLLHRLVADLFSSASVERCKDENLEAPIAVLRFEAGSITSRKQCITPYLPGR